MSPMRTVSWLKTLLPLAVLILGISATAALISSRQVPQPAERPNLGALVETLVVEAEDLTVQIEGQGEVSPKTRVELFPEVTGRIIKVHNKLVTGGRFSAGATLIQIDPRDYELAVERARASVARAEVAVEREQAEAEVAGAEWRAVNGDVEAPSLLVRRPQIRQADAELAAAEADLATAELALARTRISVPFDGLVIQENVDIGQLVNPGRAVATVIGTDAMEIRLPLSDSELAWLDIPTPATVTVDFAGKEQTWPARVDRLEGQVDPRSRMVHLVVRVDNPFDIGSDGSRSNPLMPGTFAQVRIDGHTLSHVIRVPRSTLRGDELIWVADDGTLQIRKPEVLRKSRDIAYIRADSGLSPGESIITSSLEAATQGMKIRSMVNEAANSGTGAP